MRRDAAAIRHFSWRAVYLLPAHSRMRCAHTSSVNASDETGPQCCRHTNVLSQQHIFRLSSAPKHQINPSHSHIVANFTTLRSTSNQNETIHRHVECHDTAALCLNECELNNCMFSYWFRVFIQDF